jgi:hypothetical protein
VRVVDGQLSIKISEDTQRSIDNIKASGHVYNGNVPWGFKVVGPKYGKTLEATDLARKYVPQIFQRCIDGDSLRQIAAWLDSEGVKPASNGKTRRNKKTGEVKAIGEKWNEGSVRWIILSRAYAGKHVTREVKDKEGRIIQPANQHICDCEEIVRPSVFDRANDALKSHPKRGPAKNPPLLANLRCGRCADKGIDSPMFRLAAGKKKILKYRCYGRGPQREGCGNLVLLERLDTRVVVYMLTQNDKLHSVKKWVEGESYDDEISNVKQRIRELTEAERFAELPPLYDKLAALREKQESATKGHYETFYVRKSDGSLVSEDEHLNYLDDLLTEGECFFNLDDAERREYLKTLDVRAEKTADGIRLVIDGEEIEPNPYETVLLDTAGSDIARIMLERRIPDAAEWQALLSGTSVSDSDIATIAQMFKDAQRR